MSGGTIYDWYYVNDFSGGLNVQDSPMLLRDNELQQAMNCIITGRGIIKKRDGYLVHKAPTIATGSPYNAENIYRFYGSSTATVASIVDADYRIWNMTTDAEITGGTALTHGYPVKFYDYRQYLFILNGAQFQYCSDGATKADCGYSSAAGYTAPTISPSVMEICDDRVFIASSDSDIFYWSDYGGWAAASNPGTMLFASDAYGTFPRRAQGVGITNMLAYGKTDELIIFRRNDCAVLLGVGSTDYSLHLLSTEAGCVSPRGACCTNNETVIFVGNNNVYEIRGGEVRPIGDKIKPRLANTTLTNAQCVFDPRQNIVIIQHPGGAFIYNVAGQDWDATTYRPTDASRGWTEWSFNDSSNNPIGTTAFHVCKSATDNNMILLTFVNSTSAWYMTGNTDNTGNIRWAIKSRAFDLQSFADEKIVRSVKVSLSSTDTTPFDVSVTMDGTQRVDTKTMTITLVGSTWGDPTKWGQFTWGDSERITGAVVPDDSMVGNNFSVKLSSNDTNALEIHKIAAEVAFKNRRREE